MQHNPLFRVLNKIQTGCPHGRPFIFHVKKLRIYAKIFCIDIDKYANLAYNIKNKNAYIRKNSLRTKWLLTDNATLTS